MRLCIEVFSSKRSGISVLRLRRRFLSLSSVALDTAMRVNPFLSVMLSVVFGDASSFDGGCFESDVFVSF